MTTAIIGTGNIGGTLAPHLVRGGEPVVLAAKNDANAAALAQELGQLARAASVEAAIAEGDTVVVAVCLHTTKKPIATDGQQLEHEVGFEPLQAAGVADAGRIEVRGGELHQAGLSGTLLGVDDARAAVAAELAGPGRTALSQ